MSISMHIQNLDKFYRRVLKILSKNEKMMKDKQTDGQTDERMTDNPNPI